MKKKKCWGLFSVPTITETGCGEVDRTTEKLQFWCEKTNICMNVYLPKDKNITPEELSKIMKTVLSICLHCTGKKPSCDSGYIVH